MKSVLLSLLLATSAYAQSALTFYVHDTTGHTADTPFPSIYQLNSTPEGSGSPLVLKGINSSTNTIYLSTSYVSNTAGTTDLNPNFSLTALFHDQSIPPGQSVVFTVNFVPIVTGIITGYLQVAYQIQQSGCIFNSTDPANACPHTISPVSTLTGMATAPLFVLSYPNPDGTDPVVPQPSNPSAPISFGNVNTSAPSSITFTLTNQGTLTIPTPTIGLRGQQFGTPAFQLDTTALPASLTPNAPASFVVTFAPGQIGLVGATYLDVGTNSYQLQGAGIAPLSISYVDCAMVVHRPEVATPIPVDQLSACPNGLAFTVTNPEASFSPVTLTNSTLTANPTAAFGISNLGSPLPVTLQPGQSVTFNLTFDPTAGTNAGTLSIGGTQYVATTTFNLSGQSTAFPFPGISCQVTPSVLPSQQQPTVTVNLPAPTTVSAIGVLNISFASDVANDPTIVFINPKGSNESVNIAAGTTSSPAFDFQAGTTAGTITFTLQNFGGSTIDQPCESLAIPRAIVYIDPSSSAVRSNPNLVITLIGYDNTYTVGMLSFTFYDISGKVIGSPISFDATSKFQGYFPTSRSGSAFSLIASFPVTGDVTQVGSVAVTLTNHVGNTTVTETFQ